MSQLVENRDEFVGEDLGDIVFGTLNWIYGESSKFSLQRVIDLHANCWKDHVTNYDFARTANGLCLKSMTSGELSSAAPPRLPPA